MEYYDDESINSKKAFIKNSENLTCSVVASIFFNFLFFIFLILIIINYAKGLNFEDNGILILLIIFGVISYIIFVYYELHSTTFTFLRTKSDKIIKEKIGDFFQAEPSICLES